MIIKKIKLRNIRSYLEEEIEFPEGSLLLSGNVGSGKSTILLAVDFALFGLTRGILSGGALLRNGKSEGSVELNLDINNKDIVIKRNLKKNDNSIVQDSGFILINGRKEEGTAIELKAKVLELLNYPKDLLTKSKSLIYRFTVYTPQEEMKRILTEDAEDRIEILRRVFDIDKYKRIQENCLITIRKLKEQLREGEVLISGLEEKKIEKNQLENEIVELKKETFEIEDKIKAINKEIIENKDVLKDYEEKIKKLNELRNQLIIVNNNIDYRNKEKEKINNELKKINEEILDNENLLKGFSEVFESDFDKEIREIITHINLKEKESKEIHYKINENNLVIRNSEEMINKIKNLDNCPTCFQSVGIEHKNNINNTESKKLELARNNVIIFKKKEENVLAELDDLKYELTSLQDKLNEYRIMKIKIESLKDKKKLKEKYEIELREIFDSLGDFNEQVRNLEFEIVKKKIAESKYEIIENKLEELNENIRNLEIKKAGFSERIYSVENNLKRIDKEILNKLAIKRKNEELNSIIKWLDEQFLAMMEKMERSVMLRLHKDFDALFRNWFSILIDNEILNVRLDNEFSPIITQDDYEIEYDFLSGGEKTAVALAYRLSLNQVINNLMSLIETKDIIILDEPTDGFSREQLDRVRIVLDELNIKQIIIVSHEDEIESFVDNVIRFEKKGNVSKVVK